ncbi:hypothetical protein KW783_04260 [Candidatus Parcubacteria bacterium]|nr:hypothetical protein [Candidatus Parcubacteria bacterium]
MYNDTGYDGEVWIDRERLGDLKRGKILYQPLIVSNKNTMRVDFWAFGTDGKVVGSAMRAFPVSIYADGDGFDWHVREVVTVAEAIGKQ